MSEAGTRYTELTPTNQSANVWVVALISLTLTAVCLAIRIVSKVRYALKFAVDDYVFAFAWVMQVVQVSITIKGLTLGLGKDASIVDPSNFHSIQSYLTASIIIAFIALFVTKISMVLLVQRLFTRQFRIWWIFIAVMGLATAIQINADCAYPTCRNILPRTIAASACDLASEVITIALPVYTTLGLKMQWMRKISVIASFSTRIIVMVLIGLALWSLTKVEPTGQLSPSITFPMIFLQLELCFSICIAGIIPCMRMLFQSSDLVPTGSYEYPKEPKRNGEGNAQPAPFAVSSSDPHSTDANTEISFVRMATPPPPPPPPKKSEHSAQSSREVEGVHTTPGSRRSEKSLVPSATTGLSQKPLIQTPMP